MKYINILISWNQSINEWITHLNSYIEKIDQSGRYYLGDEWDIIIENMSNYTKKITSIDDLVKDNIFTYFNEIEYMIDELLYITDKIVSHKIIDELSIKYRTELTELFNKIHSSKVQCNAIFHEILSKIDIFNELNTENVKNGLTIVSAIITNKFKNNKNITKLEKFKEDLLNIDYKKYNMPDTILNIQKINFFIYPILKTIVNPSKYLDVSIFKQCISYDIMPLIDKKSAIKFGPIQSIYTGINKQLIDRFRSIIIEQYKHVDSKGKDIQSVKTDLPIYTGSSFKNITPIYNKDMAWYPMKGSNPIVYKYNELLEEEIFKNMTVDASKYNEFEKKKYKNITNIDEIKNAVKGKKRDQYEKIISEVCFNHVDRLINLNKDKLLDKDIVQREAYLMQFFNSKDILYKVFKNDYQDLEIIPVTYNFINLKLI